MSSSIFTKGTTPNRILCIALSVTLVIGLMPTFAWADDYADVATSTNETVESADEMADLADGALDSDDEDDEALGSGLEGDDPSGGESSASLLADAGDVGDGTETEILYSGKSGTCTWAIDANGKLIVQPTDGISGKLASWIPANGAPWFKYASKITSAVFAPGVSTGTCAYMFSLHSNLTSIDLSGLDTSSVTNMEGMFSECRNLVNLNFADLDTSSVVNMSDMFLNCRALSSINLEGLNTSSVTSMAGMFTQCYSLERIDLSPLDTSSVQDMSSMFCNCEGLVDINLGGMDTSSTTNMESMFNGCSTLASLELTSFDTKNVTNMWGMFANCDALQSLDISSFDTDKAGVMTYMFDGLNSIQIIYVRNNKEMARICSVGKGLPKGTVQVKNAEPTDSTWNAWLTSEWKVDNGELIIQPAGNLERGMMDSTGDIAVAPWLYCSSQITSIKVIGPVEAGSDSSFLFAYCDNLTSADLSGLDMSHIQNASSMFEGCSKLTEIPNGFSIPDDAGVDNLFRVDSPTEMRYTGTDKSLIDYDWASDNRVLTPNAQEGWERFGFSQWTIDDGCLTIGALPGEASGALGDISIATDAPWYSRCDIVTSVEIDGDVASGTTLAHAFEGYANLVKVDLRGLDVSSAEDLMGMFEGCCNLVSANLNGWNTPVLKNTSMMFADCSSLVEASMIGWDFSKNEDMRQMFLNCLSLTRVPAGFTIPDGTQTTKCFYVSEPKGIAYDSSNTALSSHDWAADNRIVLTTCEDGHAWDDGIVISNPTCTNPGTGIYACTVCGAVQEYAISAKGHSTSEPIVENQLAPTCMTSGSHDLVRYCSDCGAELSREHMVDPAIGHEFIDYISDGNATCTTDGTKTASCTRCGVADTVTDEGSSLGHEFIDYVSDDNATCTSDGTKTAKCTRCDATDTVVDEGSMLDHVATEPVIENAVASTCEIDGSHDEVTYCLDCGTELSRETVTDSAIGHSWSEWTVTSEPTCTEAGLEQRVCSNDPSHIDTRYIEAIGHDYEQLLMPATMAGDGKIETVCSRCGDVSSTTVIPGIGSVSLKTSSYTFDGKEKAPAVTVKDGSGAVIGSGNYTVSYSSNKYVGTATAKVTFKGNYSGTVTKSFKIVAPSIAKPTNYTPTSYSKALKAKWKKVSGVTGYKVTIATNSKFTKGKKTYTVKGSSATSKKVTKLKAKTKYYVKVQAYKTVAGKTFYGSWSSVKTVKTK
ncbi:MAG: BspA family leucine-rich repeat surface protein [Eggerthellales bacterium]|nr:BspA family leucine-rich repeat surface protein [Eggerthellales bacterium]